ncbi:MAG: FAD-dependent oxidoreductase [Propionibacteriaceae bacterium]|nr:FAD-dependent oxidoreductase [Propionibacteriaceae bacterium]
MQEIRVDLAVIGGGVGGVAAALAGLDEGLTVLLSEESPWLGGQLTSQMVPPDENYLVESVGRTRSYADFRQRLRDYYRRNYPLTEQARREPALNPGAGGVSAICHEPQVAKAVIDELLAAALSSGRLQLLRQFQPFQAEVDGDLIQAVALEGPAGQRHWVQADCYIDATELGDLVELAGAEHVIGAESQADTGEPHAPSGPAAPEDQQAITWCFVMDYLPDQDHTIDRPAEYDFWRSYRPDFWPGPLFSWTDPLPTTLEARTEPLFAAADSPRGGVHRDRWNFRRILSTAHLVPGSFASDITVVNWPQIDYFLGPLLGVDPATRQRHLAAARQQALCFAHWLQTEAPRHDGGQGYPGLRLRGDVAGSPDGLALRPYIREARRIKAETTILEQQVGVEARRQAGLPDQAEHFLDSVGIGSYRIDLHPSTGRAGRPRTYVDIASYPFEIPLGALLPQRLDNLLAGAKNIGSTHITNGCYRLHPVEWNIGQAAGALAAFAGRRGLVPRAVRQRPNQLTDFQARLQGHHGVPLRWPDWARSFRN